jgi:peptidoglycan/xylan/chitin deacetylase (PgdA/CDA1 family)
MSPREKIKRPIALIHIDCDGLFCINDNCYRDREWAYDYIFFSAMPMVIRILDQCQVKATFFVVAQDLEDKNKLDLLMEVVNKGHRVASHSYSHADLGHDGVNLKQEIVDSKAALEKNLMVPVLGFRAPGYSINKQALILLEDNGYQYDSSVFPTKSFARKIDFNISKYPFRVGPNKKLIELPLPGSLPLLPPWHPSFAILLGRWYYDINFLTKGLKANPYVLLFHLIDFSEPLPNDLISGMKDRLMSGSVVSKNRKIRLSEYIIKKTMKHFDIKLTETMVMELAGC